MDWVITVVAMACQPNLMLWLLKQDRLAQRLRFTTVIAGFRVEYQS